MKLTLENLSEIEVSGDVTQRIKSIAALIYAAMNDWPDNVGTFDEYLQRIEETIGETVNKQSIQDYLEKAKRHNDAWKSESLAGLLDIFNYYGENLSLREIVNAFTNEILPEENR